MKLNTIAKVPVLTRVELNDKEIIELYGEPLEFWMYDRQDLSVFLRMAQMKGDNSQLMSVIRDLILDETGEPMLQPNEILPIEVLTPLASSVVNRLGNLKSRTTVT